MNYPIPQQQAIIKKLLDAKRRELIERMYAREQGMAWG